MRLLQSSEQLTDMASTSAVLLTNLKTYSSSSEAENGSSDGIGDDDEIVSKTGFRKKRPIPKRRGKKVQPNPCAGKKCGNNCEMNFRDEDRTNINKLYWGLGSSVRQRNWLLSLVEETNIRRRRVESGSKRLVTYHYFFPWGNGDRKKVCQQFVLKTLGISQMKLRYTVKNRTVLNLSKPNKIGSSTATNRSSESVIQGVTIHSRTPCFQVSLLS